MLIVKRSLFLLTFCLLFTSQVFAKNLIVFGGSFDPPTLAHEQTIRALAQQPDSEVLVMVNTGGKKQFKHSALERALFLSAGLHDLGSRIKIVFQAYARFGTIPVLVRALKSGEFNKVTYVIGQDVHKSWGGDLPQLGERLVPPLPLYYDILPRLNPGETVLNPIPLKNPTHERVISVGSVSDLSSSQIRESLNGLAWEEDESLEALKEGLSAPVRHILATEKYLRNHDSIETDLFQEVFAGRYLELRRKLSLKFPEYEALLKQSAQPPFEPTASRLAWDEWIVRSFVDTISKAKTLDNFTLENWPTDVQFPSSTLFYQFMTTINPSYAAFSPVPFENSSEKIGSIVFTNRLSANATTAQKHRLGSGSYVKGRKAFHQEIIDAFKKAIPPQSDSSTRLVLFLAGPPGAGKTSVLKIFQDITGIQLPVLSIDDFRASIIEKDFSGPQTIDAIETARRTHEESAHIQGLLWADLVAQGSSFVVDGTLSATEYFSGYFERLKAQNYKVGILYVTAPEDQLLARIQERAKREKRENPVDHVKQAIAGAENSWNTLASKADFAIRIENPNTQTGVPAPLVKMLWKGGASQQIARPLVDCADILRSASTPKSD